MKFACSALIATLVAISTLGRGTLDSGAAQAPSRLTALPEDPCELLTLEEMSSITNVSVTAVQQIPRSLSHEPDAGTLCEYQTQSAFGSIFIQVPSPKTRSGDPYWGYWAVLARTLDTFPKTVEPVAGIGQDAWLGGRTALFVLVRSNESFRVSAQNTGPEWRLVAPKIAKAIVDRF